MKALRIPIVEDDAILAGAVARNLTARGYQTEVASTVSAAKQSMNRAVPDVLLLDVDLPDGSGWEIGRLLRVARLETPMIVISGLRPNDRLVHELSCMSFLEKPFPMESLVRQIEMQLSPAGSKWGATRTDA